MLLDGVSFTTWRVTSDTVPGSVPAFTAAYLSISEGSHVVTHTDSSVTFGVYVNGRSAGTQVCGYSYPAGLCLKNETQVNLLSYV